jgi:hypothetical protein
MEKIQGRVRLMKRHCTAHAIQSDLAPEFFVFDLSNAFFEGN